MRTLHDNIRKYVATQIYQKLSLEVQNAISLLDLSQQLVEPPNPEMADLAFGCFILAKLQKTSPANCASELKKQIELDANITSIEAAGPYLNFKLSSDFFGKEVLGSAIDGSLFHKQLSQNNPKTMVEYSQPNTHKELHVGHMRNLCLGDSLVRMMKYAGYPIISSTFPGDVGTHVAKCLWYMKFHNSEPVPQTQKGEWLGRMYSKAHIKLEDEKGSPQEELNRQSLTQILKQLEEKSGEFYDLWKETRAWSIDLMKQAYQWADVSFDHWYWESDVDSTSVQWVKKLYSEGKIIESQGAIGMNLEADNLGFCLLLKSDGTGLYATKDLELARRKFEDFKIEKSIYVVDMRQALHFKQVFKTLEHLGFEQAKNCFHLQYNYVELPDGAMSSRKGNIVPLFTLIHNMEQMIQEQYLARYKNEWSEEEIQKTASIVAKGAIRYGMLRMDNNKKIVFDMKEWLRLDGESGPFIQYSCTRIKSLIRKFGYDEKSKAQWSLLTHQTEKNLMQSILNFNSLAVTAADQYKPALICTFLYDLAKRFNQFYHDCPIGTAENAELKNARMALSLAVGKTLEQGLSLLGIPTPERM